MKYLKTFENFGQFDLGRFSEEDATQAFMNNPKETEDAENVHHEREDDLEREDDKYRREEEEKSEEENEGRPSRVWGDEVVVEKKKINAGFQAYLDKKAGKKADKKEDKKDDKKETKKSTTKKETTYDKSELKHPEKADLNKDKKISGYEKVRGKAIQNAVQDEKEEKGGKGLTAAQKKLPAGLQKAIAAKKK